jgi:hypothetical protein
MTSQEILEARQAALAESRKVRDEIGADNLRKLIDSLTK